MLSRHVSAPTGAAHRTFLSLGLAAGLLISALAPPVPAQAQGPVIRDHRDPYARILLVVKSVKIHNDMDWGDGEFAFSLRVHAFDDVCTDSVDTGCANLLVQGGLPGFSGPAGTVKQVNRVVPAYGDTVNDRAVAPPFGIPIREGSRYGFTITGTESDPRYDDDLGSLTVPFTDEAGQVRFGTHTQRAFGGCVDRPPVGVDFCGPDSPDDPSGGFEIEYEIRRAPVPDLRIGGLKVLDLPGTATKLVCAGVINSEAGDAGPFEAVLRIDGGQPVAKATAGRLAAGTSGDLCFEAVLPATGQHELTVVVDEADGVLEFNERNNTYSPIRSSARSSSRRFSDGRHRWSDAGGSIWGRWTRAWRTSPSRSRSSRSRTGAGCWSRWVSCRPTRLRVAPRARRPPTCGRWRARLYGITRGLRSTPAASEAAPAWWCTAASPPRLPGCPTTAC